MGGSSFEDREVTWKALDLPVYGTITRPADREKYPAVIFIAGSGPTDRNWCSPLLPGTNGSAKLLAEALATRGFITLRYDKLPSGPHARENVPKLTGKISMQSHLEELAGAVETILSEPNVNELFVLTNSEGAIHAVNYQLQTKGHRFAGLVLSGAPGRTIGQVSRDQIFAQARALPNPDDMMKHYDEAIADFLGARPISIDPSLPRAIHPFFKALEIPTNLPFSRELWTFNLAEHISQVDAPLLILIGKKDIQVDWRADGQPLENALKGRPTATFVYPENANHVLKHEELPREKITAQYVATHYNAPDAVLDAEASNTICSWLNVQSSGQR